MKNKQALQTTPMKILQLISSNGFFGAENVLVQLANELNNKSSCSVVTGVIKNMSTPHTEVSDQCKQRGVETMIFSCKGKLDLRMISRLRQYCKFEKIDIIHSHGYKANLYTHMASLGLPISRVATCHNWLGDDPFIKFYTALDKYFLRNFSYVVAVSPDVHEQIIKSKVPPEKTRIIDNGIDISCFDKDTMTDNLKISLGIPENHIVVGTVGRISSEKGHQHLLNIFNSIERKYPSISFLIVGDGHLKNKLQKKFRKKNIIFTGIRNDLPELYHCMDIFVLPSLTEGLPMVLLEAMASALPVVASRVGSIPNVLVENKTGFLVAPGDEDGLKKHIQTLLSDPETRTRMGRKGRKIVREGFSSIKMAQEYLSIYRDCLEKRA